MTNRRSDVVVEGKEGVYHCYSRCVRRAYLCGWDKLTGKNYDHRKKWIKQRLKFLSSIFAIDVLAYSVMSNHPHTVLRVKPCRVDSWSDREVARRWKLLFASRYKPDGKPCEPNEVELNALITDRKRMKKLRNRLANLSWFMRCLNEYIANRANAEDCCSGRFWEGRFKCQRIEDPGALLACMVYVDLNPIRANKAQTLEESDYTGIQDRIVAHLARRALAKNPHSKDLKEQAKRDEWLVALDGNNELMPNITFERYLEIADATGREARKGKRGHIPWHIKPVLEKLGIRSENWLQTSQNVGRDFYHVVGKLDTMAKAAKKLKRSWLKGMSASKNAFVPA